MGVAQEPLHSEDARRSVRSKKNLSLRKVVTTSSDSENDSSSENSSEIKPRPPRVPNFSKKSELRSTTTTASSKTASATKSAGDSTANVNTTTNHRSSRDRTRI